jgi:hypothetical protein
MKINPMDTPKTTAYKKHIREKETDQKISPTTSKHTADKPPHTLVTKRQNSEHLSSLRSDEPDVLQAGNRSLALP